MEDTREIFVFNPEYEEIFLKKKRNFCVRKMNGRSRKSERSRGTKRPEVRKTLSLWSWVGIEQAGIVGWLSGRGGRRGQDHGEGGGGWDLYTGSPELNRFTVEENNQIPDKTYENCTLDWNTKKSREIPGSPKITAQWPGH